MRCIIVIQPKIENAHDLLDVPLGGEERRNTTIEWVHCT